VIPHAPLLLLLCLSPFWDGQGEKQIEYRNTQYGFKFALPEHWKGYSIITREWEGAENKNDRLVERGPMFLIRNPKWTSQDPYQAIPIMVFTIRQWNALQKHTFHVGTAPIGPGELGRNSKYVFALPPRFDYDFLTGYQEAEAILARHPLRGFD